MKTVKIIILTKEEKDVLIKTFCNFKNSEEANYNYFGELLVYMADNDIFIQSNYSIEKKDMILIKNIIQDFKQEFLFEKIDVGYFITQLIKKDGSIPESVLGYIVKIV